MTQTNNSPPAIKEDKPNQNKPRQNQLHSLIPHYPPFKPIKPPSIDIAFTTKPFYIRTTEALIYAIRSLEYAISPKGSLRYWFKLNFLIMLWIAIPTITLTPILTYLMSQFVNFTHDFNSIIQNLYQAFLPLIIIIAIITAIVMIIKK